MNELPDTLNRALLTPLTIEFEEPDAARLWVFRAHNYIRRQAPELKQLMISRRGATVFVRVPKMRIREE